MHHPDPDRNKRTKRAPRGRVSRTGLAGEVLPRQRLSGYACNIDPSIFNLLSDR